MQPEPEQSSPQQPQIQVAPPVVATRRSGRFTGMLARTSSAFTAEYTMYLIALGIVLSNLAALIYIFFGLVVSAANGMGGIVPMHMFTLWLFISSVVAFPLTYVLWRRTQGELTANEEFKGELPKGAAKGFRTFWIILSALGMLGLLILALYAPIAAAITTGAAAGIVVLSVTLPALLNIAIAALGIYLVTRGVQESRRTRMIMLVVAGLTALLFTICYIWGSSAPATSTPARPSINTPSNRYDPYDDLYKDSYYDYSSPNYR